MLSEIELRRLKSKLFLRVPIVITLILGALLLSAGSVWYWQAWMVCGTTLILMLIVMAYFFSTDPEFLAHRLQFKEKEKAQRKIVGGVGAFFPVMLVIAGFDMRLRWSEVPEWLCFVGLGLFLVTYCLVIWVFKVNRYASRIIEIQPDQKVISSGPYSVVRHPMYSLQLILYPSFLLALGSLWGFFLSFFLAIPFIFRIQNEEEVLKKGLPGYQEYCAKTRYRLFPYVW